jgi:trans-aconitate 2-methyltransferase
VKPDDPAAFLRTVVLGVHLDRLPHELHDTFVSAVLARAGTPLELGYVRLNMEARRP